MERREEAGGERQHNEAGGRDERWRGAMEVEGM